MHPLSGFMGRPMHNRIELERPTLPLLDRHNRIHRSMRISVTDVCNIRCRYCMPGDAVQFMPPEQHLSYDELASIVRVCVRLGIHDYRITGGEPLTRPGLAELFSRLNDIAGVQSLALTTNGMMLKDQLSELTSAGLRRVNISLDTLRDDVFQKLCRRSGLHKVLEGIEAAVDEPRIQLRLNALVLRDINLEDAVELVAFARARRITLRFIEFMPLDADRSWTSQKMVSGQELREILANRFGAMLPVKSNNASQPSVDYQFEDGSQVGFIDSVSSPFCNLCDRLRLTADGKLRNCLFGKEEWDLKGTLAISNNEAEFSTTLEQTIRNCVDAKAAAHGIETQGFQRPQRSMYQIGG